MALLPGKEGGCAVAALSPSPDPPGVESRPLTASVLQHEALSGIPIAVLANKCDVRGAVDTPVIWDRVVKGTSPLVAGAGSGATVEDGAGVAGKQTAAAEQAPSEHVGVGVVGASTPSRRECRIFRASALSGEGVKVAVDWLVNAAKQYMYSRESAP